MRWRVRVILCLFLGLIATVLVAWAAALYSPFTRPGWTLNHEPVVENGRLGPWRIPEGWEIRTHGVLTGAAIQYEIVTEMEWMGSRLGAMMDRSNRSMDRTRAGWPFYALEYRESVDELATRPSGWRAVYLGGIESWVRHRPLPIKPVWTGLLLDAVLYGAALFALSAAPGAFVRARRRRRGLCLKCAYELKGLSVCPECGRADESSTTAKQQGSN